MSLMLSEAIDFWIKQRRPKEWEKYLRKLLKEEYELLKIKNKEWVKEQTNDKL